MNIRSTSLLFLNTARIWSSNSSTSTVALSNCSNIYLSNLNNNSTNNINNNISRLTYTNNNNNIYNCNLYISYSNSNKSHTTSRTYSTNNNSNNNNKMIEAIEESNDINGFVKGKYPEKYITITTFNILAPCYIRLPSPLNDMDKSFKRQEAIIQSLLSMDSDVINLQEFFFSDVFKSYYESKLSNLYNSFYLQRTNHKKDGLAIFLKKSFNIIAQKYIEFNDEGDRVALLIHIKSPGGKQFILVNTHLTFPHTFHDEKILRLSQIQLVDQNINQYIRDNHLNIPVIVCGDMNSPYSPHEESCVVKKYLFNKNYKSAYNLVHPNNHNFVSHRNHLKQEVGVDFIFFKDHFKLNNSNNNNNNANTQEDTITQLNPVDSYFYPRNISVENWPSGNEQIYSDHRALTTTFEIINPQ